MSTTAIHHSPEHVHTTHPLGCGGALVGDWDTVACSKCGLRVNTLDVTPTKGHVLRLAPGGVLVEMAV